MPTDNDVAKAAAAFRTFQVNLKPTPIPTYAEIALTDLLSRMMVRMDEMQSELETIKTQCGLCPKRRRNK